MIESLQRFSMLDNRQYYLLGHFFFLKVAAAAPPILRGAESFDLMLDPENTTLAVKDALFEEIAEG